MMNETIASRALSGWVAKTRGVGAGVHLFGATLCLSALVNYVPRPDIATAAFAVAYLLLVAHRISKHGLALQPTRVNLTIVALLAWFALSGVVAYFHKTEMTEYVRGMFPFLFLATYFLFDLKSEHDRRGLVKYLIAASLLWGAAIVYSVGVKLLAQPDALVELAQARLVKTEPNTVLPFGMAVLPFLMLSRPRIVGLIWIVLLTGLIIWSGYRLWLAVVALEILACFLVALLRDRAMVANVAVAAATVPLALTFTFAVPIQFLFDLGIRAWFILGAIVVGLAVDQLWRRRFPVGLVAGLALSSVILLVSNLGVPETPAISVQSGTPLPALAEAAPTVTVEEAPVAAMMRRLSFEALLTDSRLDEVEFAWGRFLESPIFGKGLGFQLPASVTFPEDVMAQVSIEDIPETAGYLHNVVAYLLMNTGFVGLLLYLLVILMVLVPALNQKGLITRAAIFALLALLIFANFSAVFRLVQFSLLLVAILKLLDDRTGPKRAL